MELHRVPLDPIGLHGEWVDIPLRLNWGARCHIEDAARRANLYQPNALYEFRMAEALAYVKRWSFVGDVVDATVEAMDADVLAYVCSEANLHYERTDRRTPAERKSEPTPIREGSGVGGVLAGDGAGG